MSNPKPSQGYGVLQSSCQCVPCMYPHLPLFLLCHALHYDFWPYQFRYPLKHWPHHFRERELHRCSAHPIEVPYFGCSDAPDAALLGQRSPRDPAPSVPAPCWRDVTMALHGWVPSAIPRPCMVSSSPVSDRGSSQERTVVHPRPAQPRQQRRAPRRCWGAISPPHCWVIQEGSCSFIEEMYKFSSLKALDGLKYIFPQSRPESTAELSFSGTHPAAAVPSSKAFGGDKLRNVMFLWLLAPGTVSCSLSCAHGLCVFFLQVFFFLNEMLPISNASMALWTLCWEDVRAGRGGEQGLLKPVLPLSASPPRWILPERDVWVRTSMIYSALSILLIVCGTWGRC